MTKPGIAHDQISWLWDKSHRAMDHETAPILLTALCTGCLLEIVIGHTLQDAKHLALWAEEIVMEPSLIVPIN